MTRKRLELVMETPGQERQRERERESQFIDLVSVGGDGKGEEEFLRGSSVQQVLGRSLSVGRSCVSRAEKEAPGGGGGRREEKAKEVEGEKEDANWSGL